MPKSSNPRFLGNRRAEVVARSKPLAAQIQRWLIRFARIIVADELQNATLLAKSRVAMTKATDSVKLRKELEALIVQFGIRQANTAASSAVGSGIVVVESQFMRDFFRPRKGQRRKETLVQGIAKETRQAVRRGIQKTIEEAVGEIPRPSTQEIARRIRERFGTGTDANLAFAVSKERAQLIAQTELVQAENAGIVAGYEMVGIKKMKWLAFSDGRSGDRHHERMNSHPPVEVGKTFTTPLGNKLRFPGDPRAPIRETARCFPAGTAVTASPVAALRAEYDGPMIQVATRGGAHLAVTPNHPVLTPTGFRLAQDLRSGDYLIGHSVEPEGLPVPGITDDEEHMPSMIEDAFSSILGAGCARSREVRIDDLHGDARWCDGDVDIVLRDGSLLDDVETARDEDLGERILEHAAVVDGVNLCDGALGEECLAVASAATGGPGGLELAHLLSSAFPGPLDELGFTAPPDRHTVGHEPSPEERATEAGLVRNLIERSAGTVSVDQVVQVGDHSFSGHVYDLQTKTGLQIANGIVCSNCRCTVAPVR